jgi:hypothetical protein
MSKNVIIVLIYHRHKLLDHTPIILFVMPFCGTHYIKSKVIDDYIIYKLNMLQIRGLQYQEKLTQKTKNSYISHYMWFQYMQITQRQFRYKKPLPWCVEVIVIKWCMNRSETEELCSAYH